MQAVIERNRARNQVDDAAVTIQRVYRGWRARSTLGLATLYDVLNWRKGLRSRVINPLKLLKLIQVQQKKAAGFRNLICYIIFLSLFFVVVFLQLHVASLYRIESGIRNEILNLEFSSDGRDGMRLADISSHEDMHHWLRTWYRRVSQVDKQDLVFSTPVSLSAIPGLEAAIREPMNFTVATEFAYMTGAPVSQEIIDRHVEAALQVFPIYSNENIDEGAECAELFPSDLNGLIIVRAITISSIFTRAYLAAVTGETNTIVSRGFAHPERSGYLHTYGRFYGGIVISQARRKPIPCEDVGFSDLYPTCYEDEGINDVTPFSTISPTDPSVPATVFRAQGTTFSQTVDGGVYGLGTAAGLCYLNQLEAHSWTSAATREVSIMFGIFNGHLRSLTAVEILFTFSLEGEVIPSLKVESITLRDKSVSFSDVFRTAVIILFYGIVFGMFGHEVLQIVRLARATGVWYKYFTSFWRVLDFLATCNFITLEVLDLVIMNRMGDFGINETITQGSDNNAAMIQAIIQEVTRTHDVANLQGTYNVLVTIALYMGLLRIFKYLRFHDRLSIVTRTLEKGAQELGHFSIMFVVVVGMFSIIAHAALGPKLESYRTLWQALQSTLLITVGDMSVYRNVPDVAPVIGPLIYWTLIIVVYILLLNILLSILIDAFLEVRKTAEDQESVWTSLAIYLLPRLEKCGGAVSCARCRRKQKKRKSVAPADLHAGPPSAKYSVSRKRLGSLRRASNALSSFAHAIGAVDTVNRFQTLRGNESFRLVMGDLNTRLKAFRSTRFAASKIGSSRSRKWRGRNKVRGVEKLLEDLARVKRKVGDQSDEMSEGDLVKALGPSHGRELVLDLLHYFGEEPGHHESVPVGGVYAPSAIESLRREQSDLKQQMSQMASSMSRLASSVHSLEASLAGRVDSMGRGRGDHDGVRPVSIAYAGNSNVGEAKQEDVRKHTETGYVEDVTELLPDPGFP